MPGCQEIRPVCRGENGGPRRGPPPVTGTRTGQCCLELHSNKAERRKFLGQLQAAWEQNSQSPEEDWLSLNEELQVHRDELNAYVATLHRKAENGWSVFEAMAVSAKGRERYAPKLHWPPTRWLSSEAYQLLVKLAREMSLTFAAVKSGSTMPFIHRTEWSAAWEQSLLSAADDLANAGLALRKATSSLSASLEGISREDQSWDTVKKYRRLAKAVLATADEDYQIVFHKQFSKLLAGMKDLEESIRQFRTAKSQTTALYSDEERPAIPIDELDAQWRQAVASMWPMSWFAKRKVRRFLQTYAKEGQANPQTDLAPIRIMQNQLARILANDLAEQTRHWQRQDTDTTALRNHLQIANEVRESILALGNAVDSLPVISKSIGPILKGAGTAQPLLDHARSFLEAFHAFATAGKQFEQIAGKRPFEHESPHVIEEALGVARQIHEHRTELKCWTAWCKVKQQALARGLEVFVTELQAGRVAPEDVPETFELAFVRWWLPWAVDQNEVLRNFQRFRHEDAIQQFRKLDDFARESSVFQIRQAIRHALPKPDEVPRKSELGLLRHQMGLQRPSKSIREVISFMPEAFGQLAPCLLMSPLSIAQYLPANQSLFDVVIFDEASQITTWDAIGAIARGKQTIIVGDPKQLPPTNFFGRTDNDEDNEELEDHERDLESILDEAKASGLPTLQLNWHYRSRHESLIAFSNWHYYNNQLITFPSAFTKDQSVSLKHLPNAIYDRGKSKTNADEARTIVHDAVVLMKEWLTLPEDERLTLGVITFNSQQQSLIQNYFDDAQRKHPELEWFFSDDRIEPTVVKNLENVQGDERDVMLFSVTFGRDQAGKFYKNFGAVNRDGGERRLNVAVTRAREKFVVYSSFKAEELAIESSQKLGVKHLKNLLDYADRGAIALAAETSGSVGDYDSPFEEAVADALIARGWQVVPQIGVSGFRVDLGIVHPEKPGTFLAGIECDGATYHRSATARDRDKVREQVLRNLGWEIIRIWSPDWWYDAKGATERVNEQLNELLENDRVRVAEANSAAIGSSAVDEDEDLAESAPYRNEPCSHHPLHLDHFLYLSWPSRRAPLSAPNRSPQWGRIPQTCRNRGQSPHQPLSRALDDSGVAFGNRSPRGRPERGTACRPGRSLAPGPLDRPFAQ